MSLGPDTQINKVEISKFDRIHGSIKKVAEKYFTNPLHYIFYTMLSGTIIGLFFQMKFSWQYYLILILLALPNGYQQYKLWISLSSKQSQKPEESV